MCITGASLDTQKGADINRASMVLEPLMERSVNERVELSYVFFTRYV